MAGLLDDTIPPQEQAIRLSPRDSLIGVWYQRIGTVLRSRTDEAHTARYAHALLAATKREDLVQPKKVPGLSAEQMARMEREMDGLQREFKTVSAS